MKTWKKRVPALLLALVMCLSLLPAAALAAEDESGVITLPNGSGEVKILPDGTVIIPEGTTTLNGGTFVFNRADVRSVVIPDSVTHFAGGPFLDCINLSSVTLGRGLTKIESDAFMRCTSLKSITIPNGITSIGKDAFKDSGLETVNLSASVTSIGTGALRTDTLSEVYYAGTMAQWSVVERNCDSVLNNKTKTSPPIHCSDGVVPAGPIVTTDPSTWWTVGPNNPYPIGGGTNPGGSTNPDGGTNPGGSETILNKTAFYGEAREGYDVEKQGLTRYVHLAKPYNDTRYTITQYPANFDVTPGESDYGPTLTIKPKSGLPAGSYSDVPSNSAFAQAVSWAVAKGVANGTSATTFSPGKVCNRGEIVTFLYRAYH